MSLFQQQREQARQTIMDTSIQLFRKDGYEATTIEKITKTVGIAKGTFYNFYDSKKDILVQWAAKLFQTLDFGQACLRNRSIQQNMEAMADILAAYIASEEILFIKFLNEIIFDFMNSASKDQFNFKRILICIIENSADNEKLGGADEELKISILNDALFMEIIHWFGQGKTAEGLNLHLKRIIDICLNGIINNKGEYI